MRSPTFLTDPLIPLVADTSTVINLIATGCAPAIIGAVPNRIVVVDVIPGELDTGRPRGRQCMPIACKNLSLQGTSRLSLSARLAGCISETLVAGPGPETLDDGEAATIAYAVEERRRSHHRREKGHAALRCALSRHPTCLNHRCPASSADVGLMLGEPAFADAVFAALRDARMAVFPHHIEQVLRLSGLNPGSSVPPVYRRGFRASAQNAVPAEVEREA